ncbi:glucose-6-phosphate dehydrogenase [Nocardioides sp. TF02-7]|uniref:glucose-6-phosphate dehydrogenase n=1 Tax=Nocardioides sp. TF02-7 TaxID=2917724 RepID=UPI001F0676B1|nr:glucose-6-phosphate dehydrogenase [Nocardioides sp. TF02-7]UMG94508.1 glucose-6-phosphate dehydrogenase [Nocardioides sp. TF02-7]
MSTEPDLVLPACDFVIFGGTGDLARRKLLPGLYQREREGQLPATTRIIGASRQGLDDADYRAIVAEAVEQHVAADDLDPAVVRRLLDRVHHLTLDADRPEDWHTLHALLKDRSDPEHAIRVYYLAVAPQLFDPICTRLDELGVVTPTCRLVMEKPLGHDLESSRRINDAVGRVFEEQQIYRIDHYLGKESVQNLLVTRFANTFLEPLWNSRWVDHVQITVSETLGVADRAGYYDRSGALRDMVQNHLLQLLCLVAMEPPTYVGPDTVRDEKLKVLQALKPMQREDVDRDTVRGRYGRGHVEGEAVTSYADDLGRDSTTETFVAVRAEVQNWRWAGVPFYLRTGKRLGRRHSTIEVVFKEPPHAMFPGSQGTTVPNRLTICLQPDEGMQLHLTAKVPGPGGIRLRPVSLDLSYATTFRERCPEPYERLLMDVIRGNPTLFMRRDEVEAAWQWVEPILRRWSDRDEVPTTYAAGSTGPVEAAILLARDGRAWQESVA